MQHKNNKYYVNIIALTLLMIGETCFYTANTIKIYILFTGTGILIAFVNNIKRFTFRIKKDSFILWITGIYILYLLYGLMFLRAGTFSMFSIVYRYIEGIALYYLISGILLIEFNGITISMVCAGIVTLLYIVSKDGASILLGGVRIGDGLSGNVNTVGYNLGIISFMVMWSYCCEKKMYKFFLFLLFAVFMLITGSKKTLIILLADVMMLFYYERKRPSIWLKIALFLIAGAYLIFNVQYFYDIIGIRIESMIETMILGNSSIRLYSYSTDVRSEMISSAFKLFLNKPFFGGGWNYFYANTSFGYEYSHCNYVEMLCTFGLFGTIIFYSRHIHNLKVAIKIRKKSSKEIDLCILTILLTIIALSLDWAAVTFSAQCVWYLPIIFSACAIDVMRYGAYRGDL